MTDKKETVKEKEERYIGAEGTVVFSGVAFNVRCLGYKESYGNKRWLVAPLSGRGSLWTEQDPFRPEPITIAGDK